MTFRTTESTSINLQTFPPPRLRRGSLKQGVFKSTSGLYPNLESAKKGLTEKEKQRLIQNLETMPKYRSNISVLEAQNTIREEGI
jgi:hypothetical protein